MSLRSFIDVSFTILVQEYQRLGVDLLSAIDKVGMLGVVPEAEVEAESHAVDNQQSMQQLMAMMAGVKGAPV